MEIVNSSSPLSSHLSDAEWQRAEIDAANEILRLSLSSQRESDPVALSKTAKVMIVDDEVFNIKVVQEHLRLSGYASFVTITDPRLVMETIEKESPDIVLLDIMMPHIGGLEILRRIRADERVAHIPTIVLTASDNEDTKIEALELGATDFLTKPVNLAELVVRVRNVLLVKAYQDHLKDYSQKLTQEVRRQTAELLEMIRHREAADELRRTRDELEMRVRERTAELAVANRELTQRTSDLQAALLTTEAADRAKSEFLANMSHELRTPMTAIMGFADILLERPTEIDAIESAQIIKRNGGHLLNLINDILDLSKIEAGGHSMELSVCRPRRIVADVLATMKVRADAKGLPLTVEYAGAIPESIKTDPVRLRQILVNIIGNAIKFTEVGGVRVVVQSDARADGEAALRFDVIDTGIGMSEHELVRLFQPFSQVDSSVHRRFGGTGLGLAISKRLAGMLGGDITVASVFGQGSTFSVTIAAKPPDGPQLEGRPANATEQPLPTGIHPRRLDCRILLAEDGPDNQRLIAFVLRKAGADVVVVENGALAVDLALEANQKNGPFDVVLMDMQMPVMDGYEATHRLRGAGYRKPIIALTAHAMTEDRQKCLDAGCDDYLTKPIVRETVIAVVETYLAESRCNAAPA